MYLLKHFFHTEIEPETSSVADSAGQDNQSSISQCMQSYNEN